MPHSNSQMKIAESFHFATVKSLVIFSGKISGKLPPGIFTQLSEMQFLIMKMFLGIMRRFSNVNLSNKLKLFENIQILNYRFTKKFTVTRVCHRLYGRD